MNDLEFGKAIKQYNIEYDTLFGCIPCISDYSCTREAYISALEKAVKTGKKLSEFLPITVMPDDLNTES